MNKKILVVDDDQMMNSLLSFRLKKEGYQVIIAEDGQQAIDLTKEEQPDIILSDIMMPYVSGLEFVTFVRKELGLDIPIIMISAAGHEKIVLEAFDLGANDFITKPFSPSEVVVRLKKFL